jgi:hypothetical protein
MDQENATLIHTQILLNHKEWSFAIHKW